MRWLIVRIVISGCLLALFFVPHPAIPLVGRILPRQISLGTLASTLLHASPGWVLAAALLTAPIIVLVSWKWQILLRALDVRESLPRLIRMNLVGGFYSLILPGEETGQLAKGVILARHSQGDAVAASIVVDEILGTLSVFSIALAALALTHPFPLRLPIATALAIMLAVFLVLLTLAVVPQFHHVARWLLARLPMPGTMRLRFVSWLEPFWGCLSDYHRHPLHLLAAFLITAAAHMLANLSVLSTMNAVGANVSYLEVCWIYAAISALVTIPITVSGFGVREGANVVILGQLGVTPSTSLAVSLLAFAIGFVWSVPGGVLQFGIRSKAEGRRAELPPEHLAVEAAATGASR